ncbi:MAG: hypothetical protein FJ299_03340 [Planctomycetes bacterium]|nr:hypothetical protein [Planctomycetota bacterium]
MPKLESLALPGFLLSLLFAGACASLSAPLPAPTEHVLDASAEGRNKSARKAYIEARHLAPPGVEWRVVERANGERQRLKRNELSLVAASASQWTERGSNNVTGRTHSAFPLYTANRLYVGSSLGGTWHGPLGGGTYTPIGDNLYGGGHWVVALPGGGSPDVVLAATEWGQVRVTRDDGATWQTPTGLPSLGAVRKVVVKGGGSRTVFLHGKVGSTSYVLRSTNDLVSFQTVDTSTSFEGDLWTPRNANGDLYALKKTSGIPVLARSSNDGTNWTTLGNLPAGVTGGELCGSEAGAPRFYAAFDISGAPKLYRSDDAGANWTYKLDLTDYWNVLNASVTNVNLMCWGGVELHKTTNGANNFTIQNTWGSYYSSPATKLHADIQGIDVFWTGSAEQWFISTDGGTYRSTDGLATTNNQTLSGIGISQYYSTHTSSANANHIAGGSQDQGYQRSSSAPSSGSLYGFSQLISGDYGHLCSGDGTHAYVYSTYPGFTLVARGENNPVTHQVNFPSGVNALWLPPVVADPGLPTSFFWLGTTLWRYTKSVSSNTWSGVQHSTKNFAVSGGEVLSAMAFSPINPQRAYAVTTSGRLYHSIDHGVTWTQSAGFGPGSHYFYGTALVASSTDANTAWVGGSGYQGAPVWRTIDGGLTWQSYSSGLPNTLVYCLAEHPQAPGTLFAGTETAAYRRDGAGNWTDITGNEAPVTIFWSAEALPGSKTIRFGTYGRGIWDYAIDPPSGCAFSAYGTGLGGANTLALSSSSTTVLGTQQTLVTSGGLAFVPGFLAFSLGQVSAPGLGGTVLVGPTVAATLPQFSDGTGTASFSFSLGYDPVLVGLPLNFQSALFDPSKPASYALSNGLHGNFCAP